MSSVLLILCAAASAQDALKFGPFGEIREMVVDGALVAVDGTPSIFSADWTHHTSLSDHATSMKESAAGTWADRLTLGEGKTFRYQQSLHGDQLTASVTTESDTPNNGAFYSINLPIDTFSGGQIELKSNPPSTTTLPATQPAEPHVWVGQVGGVIVHDSKQQIQLAIDFGVPTKVLVQDERKWKQHSYSLLISFPGGPLKSGDSTSLTMTIHASGHVDHSPATITLDAAPSGDRFEGVGGNYCFSVDSPVTQFTLDHLHSGWARVEMRLDNWMTNSTSPAAADPLVLREMKIAGDLAQRNVPMVISVWRLPAECFVDPLKSRGEVRADRWPAVVAAAVGYLKELRDQYHSEPALFSFNEPNDAVQVKLTPEQHREVVKRFGEAFEKAALKTRMLAGDVSYPMATTAFIDPLLADTDAKKYVGAVAFHSWGGAPRASYEAWAAAAKSANLPLLVTELGYDANWHLPDAWRDSDLYAMRELRITQELLSAARPVTMLEWEFTSDYSVARPIDKNVSRSDSAKWQTGRRYNVLRQLCNLTPTPSNYLAAASDRSEIIANAFTAIDGTFAMHLSNMGPARKVTIRNVPSAVQSLHVELSDSDHAEVKLKDAVVKDGVVEIDLTPQSLVTLTTMSGE